MSARANTVAVRAVFHTAHRLPALPGKCQSLHGHTWQAWFHLSGEVDDNGMLADFGVLKAALRGWCTSALDHGTMLGAADPLVPVLRDAGTKVFVFGDDEYGHGLAWPTVEHTAYLLYRAAVHLVPVGVMVAAVEVQETENNRATYAPEPGEVLR